MGKKFDPKKHIAERKAREARIERDRKDKRKSIAIVLAQLDATILRATSEGNRAYHEGEISDLGEARYRLFRVSSGTSRRQR